MRLFTCPDCYGEGGWQDYVEVWALPYQTCPHCEGTGRITFMDWFWYKAPVQLVEWVGDTFYNDEPV